MAVGRDQHAARRRHDVDRRFCFCEPDRLGRIGDGAIEIALGAPDHRAAGQRLRQCRVEPDRFVDVGQRAVEIAERAFRNTAVLPGERRRRAELDRLIVVGDRLGVFALGAPGVAAVVKDDAARRPDPQRVVEICDRDVVLALVVIGRAAQIVERRRWGAGGSLRRRPRSPACNCPSCSSRPRARSRWWRASRRQTLSAR